MFAALRLRSSSLVSLLSSSSLLFFCVLACSANDGTGDDGGEGGSSGGNQSSGGASSSGGATNASGGASTSGGASSESGGAPSGTGGSTAACTVDPTGSFVVEGDVVHDPRTCLDWQLATIAAPNGVDDGLTGTYADAALACEELVLGGFDDWRVPTHSELASTATECKNWSSPRPPWDTVFPSGGDLWTSTPVTGTTDKYCLIQGSSGGGYGKPTSGYDVRCVRGAGTVTEVKSCNEATGCESW